MSLKLKEKINHLLLMDVLIDDDDSSFNIELRTFEKKIKKEVIGVIDPFLSFLTRYDKIITRNMLALNLDFKFKSLGLIYYFINHEQYGVVIAKNIIGNLVSYVPEILLTFTFIN